MRIADVEAVVQVNVIGINSMKNIHEIVAVVKTENITVEAEARVQEKYINGAVEVTVAITVAVTIVIIIDYIIVKGKNIEITR